MLKRIAEDATGDVDTPRDYEHTDWAEVDAFTSDFGAFVEGHFDALKGDRNSGIMPIDTCAKPKPAIP